MSQASDRSRFADAVIALATSFTIACIGLSIVLVALDATLLRYWRSQQQTRFSYPVHLEAQR